MKLLKRHLSISLGLTLSLSLLPVHSSADSDNNTITASNSLENYTYILKSPNDTSKFTAIMNKEYPDLHAAIIEEIGLVYLENSENENLGIKLNNVDQKLKEFVDVKGELPNILPPDPEPVISNENLHKVAESINSDQIPKNNLANRVQLPPLDSSYFDLFNWYLKDVTDNFKSLSIDKGEHSTIALIDSGVDAGHPLLRDNIDLSQAKSYVTNDSNVYDELGHGTTVAGILTGIAPNSTIVPYKVLGPQNGQSFWVIEAIIDAVNNNSDVINLSMGTYKTKTDQTDKLIIKAYERAVKYANKQGTIVVASAGNDAYDLDELKKEREAHLPGGLHSVITVSSNTKNNSLASYSNFGREVDFSAPGGDLSYETFDLTEMIITTFPNDRPNTILDQLIGIPQGYTLNMGTSLSAPQVSAAAALIISKYEDENGNKPSVNKVIKYLEDGSIDLGRHGKDNYFGEGKVNAYRSLMMIN